MVDTITPKMGLTKPEIGASADSWGNKLNENFNILDVKTVKNNAQWEISTGDYVVDSPDGHFYINRFNNAGVYVGTPLGINRNNGDANFQNSLSVSGSLTINGAATVNGGINIGGATITVGHVHSTGNVHAVGTHTGGAVSVTGSIAGNTITANGGTINGTLNTQTTNATTYGGSNMSLGGHISSNTVNANGISSNGNMSAAGSFSANTISNNALTNNGAMTTAGTATFNGHVANNNSWAIYTTGGITTGGQNRMLVEHDGQPTISFLWRGTFGANFGLSNDGNFYMGGWSHGGVAHKFHTTRDFNYNPDPPGTAANYYNALRSEMFSELNAQNAKNVISGRWIDGGVITAVANAGETSVNSTAITTLSMGLSGPTPFLSARVRYFQILINGTWYTTGWAS